MVVIRPALEEEHAAVGALSVAGYDADGYLTFPDGTFDDGYAGWLADAASRASKSTLLVAIDDDELVGTVTWCPYGSGDAQLAKEPHQGEFRTLSIAPEARGRGIGRALVRTLPRARPRRRTDRGPAVSRCRRWCPRTACMPGWGSSAAPSSTGRPSPA